MIKLDTPILTALTVLAALLPLSCSGDADLDEGENKQGIAEDGSDGDGAATTGDDGEGATGSTGSGGAVTSGGPTSGVDGASDGTSGTSDGEAAGGTGGSAGMGGISATGGAPATDSAGGSGSTGDSDTSTTGGHATGGGGAPECEQIQCFRAIECVETCDGPVLKSGCCPCDEGTFDRIECSSTTHGGDCVDGAMMDDGCNTCTCTNGSWACTERACPEATVCGGWAGNTCSTTEYCAYVAGQHCGAADASATCKPRPELCTQEYDPVCGCDGKTYGNDCSAAAAGTGVMSEGPCASE